MDKLIIKENGRLTNWIGGYVISGEFYAGDYFNKRVLIRSWADAKNYANTCGGLTLGNGEYFYDTFEEAMEDFNEANPDDQITLEEAKRIYIGLVAEDVNGEIEIIEEDEEC